ncbi:MAG: hypothetical protein RIQ53_3530, partial [Pseudomonadota bacterium]
ITGAPPTDGGEQALALARETFARTLEARAAGLRPPADIDAVIDAEPRPAPTLPA